MVNTSAVFSLGEAHSKLVHIGCSELIHTVEPERMGN